MKLLVWMHHVADRLGLIPGRRVSRGWVLRFSAAIMASLALWALLLWGLLLIVDGVASL